MKPVLISNNPLVWSKYPDTIKVEGNFKDVLIKVRDKVHQKHKLLTHPLTGSIKPNQTPYKSIILAKNKNNTIDLMSLKLIEHALEVVEKLGLVSAELTQDILQDFQSIDLSFMESAWDSLKPLGLIGNNE